MAHTQHPPLLLITGILSYNNYMLLFVVESLVCHNIGLKNLGHVRDVACSNIEQRMRQP